jgi:hypothetical protein
LLLVVVLTAGLSFIPRISWEGHLGGAVVGFVAAALLNAMRFGDRPRRVSALVLLVVLPVLCIGGLVATMRSGDSWEPLRAARRAAAARAVADEYNREVVPLLLAVQPTAVGPIEREAEMLIVRGTARRPDAVAAIRAKVEPLRVTAADAGAKLSGPPTGVEDVDRKLARARAFAEVRVKSFDQLLALLGGTDDPTALDAWTESRREADRLWTELGQK